MKLVRAIPILVFAVACAWAQTSASAPQTPMAPSPPLDAVLTRVQQAAQATSADLGRLRIERWKTDATQKAQMQKLADSVHRNLTSAIPDLLKEAQSSQGSVSAIFKLYHNINVLYEYMNLLSDSASAVGKAEEADPLAQDAATLDSARQELSTYIEQAATALETKVKQAAVVPPPSVQAPAKKIIVDDAKPATSRKKKASVPQSQPASTPN